MGVDSNDGMGEFACLLKTGKHLNIRTGARIDECNMAYKAVLWHRKTGCERR